MLQLFPAAIPYFLLAVILIPKRKSFFGCCLLRRFISVWFCFTVNSSLKSIFRIYNLFTMFIFCRIVYHYRLNRVQFHAGCPIFTFFLYCNPTQVILPYSCILPMKPSYSKVTCVLLQLSLWKSIVILRRIFFIIAVVPSFYFPVAMFVIIVIPHRFYLWPALFFLRRIVVIPCLFFSCQLRRL